MNLFYQPEEPNGSHKLTDDEARHAIRSLRVRPGDIIQVTNGKGTLSRCVVEVIKKDVVGYSIQSTAFVKPKDYFIHLAVAPTKNADRIEWLVEKATEIGVHSISLMKCKRSERPKMSTDRLHKLAVSAMKQSGQTHLPIINEIQTFEQILKKKQDQNFIAYVDPLNPAHLKTLAKPSRSYLILIGPEGDFTDEEVAMAKKEGFKKVSLGSTRLRTETAALAACMTLCVIND